MYIFPFVNSEGELNRAFYKFKFTQTEKGIRQWQPNYSLGKR